MRDDLISRQKAIEEIIAQEAIYSDDAVMILKRLPSAQPDVPDTNVGDTISRQAAIDAAIKADMENNSNVLSEKRARVIDRHISAVPSAQPEPCEDAVSRNAIIQNLRGR